MSIVNTDDVASGLIRSIREQVGYLLSDLPSQDPQNPLKAVIKDIQSGPRPDYPYIVVSIEENNEESGGWLRHVTAGQDDETHIVTEQSISLRVTCYGESASSILNVLRISCLDDWNRASMNQESGATFVDYSDIFRQPTYLETDFVNTAYLIATFTAVSDFTTSAGLIETVTGEGRYLRYEGDENPIVENINVSS